MKRVSLILLFVLGLCAFAQAQTEWQGLVAKGSATDFPSEGYYAASNSFSRNSIVSLTNPGNGKTIRVIVSRGLSNSNFLMTLSSDAAKALGMEGDLPVTMSAQPVMIPGISDQSIGSERPFNADPDVNPSASVGNPNAFVFDDTVSAPAIRGASTPAPTTNQTIVQSQAQPASTAPATSPVPQPVLPVQTPAPDSNSVPAASLSSAQSTQVSPAQSRPSDLDIGASSLIAGPASPGTEIVNQSARSAGTAPPTVTQTNPQTQAVSAPNIANAQGSEVPASEPPPPLQTTPSGQAALGASAANANPAIVNQSAAANSLSSPVKPVPATSAVQATPARAPSNENIVNANTSQAARPAPVTAPASGIAGGVSSLAATSPTLPQTQVQAQANPPVATQIPPVAQQAVPPAGQGSGISQGLRSLALSPDAPNTGDVARPDHIFNPPVPAQNVAGINVSAVNPALAGIGATTGRPSDDTLPWAQTPAQVAGSSGLPQATAPVKSVAGDQTYASPAGGTSLYDQELAALQSRYQGRSLFVPAPAEANPASLPYAAAQGNGDKAASLPPANAPGAVKAESSLATGAAPAPGAFNPTLASAVAPGSATAEAGLKGVLPGSSQGNAPRLAVANAPGALTAEASNPYLEGFPDSVEGNQSLPIAQAVPSDVPQSSLAGSQPGLSVVPSKTDLPLAALEIQKVDPSLGNATAPEGAQIAGSTLPSPVEKGQGVPEDPVQILRPSQTVVSLAPADYRPPEIAKPSDDSVSGASVAQSPVSGNLAEAQVKGSGAPDASLAGAGAAQSAAPTGNLSEAQVKGSGAPDASLAGAGAAQSAAPTGNLSEAQVKGSGAPDASLAAAGAVQSAAPSTLAQPAGPQSADPSLAASANQTGTDNSTLAVPGGPARPDAQIAGLPSPGSQDVSGVALSDPRVPGLPDVSNPLGAPNTATGSVSLAQPSDHSVPDLGTPNPANPQTSPLAATTPAQPGIPPVKTNPVNPTNPVVSPDSGNLVAALNQANQANQTTTQTTPTTTATVPAGVDETWANANLPIVKNLERKMYYLQVGAFANPRSAKQAVDEVAPGYKVLVLPEKSASRQVYKVYVGPLNEDEKGLVLYLFRSKGYRDAFIKQGGT